METKKLGQWGEGVALEFLRKNGYSLAARGFRSRFGEIDIIVKNRDFVVFVEVKLRKNADFAQAREYVGKTKQEKIKKTAEFWLILRDTNLQPRFDVIEIYAPQGVETKSPEIIHLENAF